jgi:myo-inositol-1(or 4)-monophosphatase
MGHHDGAFLDSLLTLATSWANETGELIREGLLRERTLTSKSSTTDLVTEMDSAAEKLIVAAIDEHRPDDGILGEEGTSRTGSTGVRWVIDPIDGTTNYVYRHPFFSVSVGVEIDGVGVAGAVCAPMIGDTYSARLGGGAFRNGLPIAVSTETDLAHALIGTGFGYKSEVRAVQGQRVAALIPHIRDVRRGGSAAIDLCFVADGRLDGYYEDGLNPWDECAGLVIAAEAGAVASRIELSRPTLVVSTPSLHPLVEGLLRSL